MATPPLANPLFLGVIERQASSHAPQTSPGLCLHCLSQSLLPAIAGSRPGVLKGSFLARLSKWGDCVIQSPPHSYLFTVPRPLMVSARPKQRGAGAGAPWPALSPSLWSSRDLSTRRLHSGAEAVTETCPATGEQNADSASGWACGGIRRQCH